MKTGFLKVLALLLIFCQFFPNKTYTQGSAVTKTPEEQIKFQDNISQFNQVDFLSGNPNIQINIWEIKLNGFSLPINLSYNINRVQVENTSSWVGLGWDLNVGGSISRNIRDFPDDIKAKRPQGIYTTKKFGYIKGGANRVKDFRMDYAQTWRNTYELVNTSGTIVHWDDNKEAYKICPDEDGDLGSYYDTEPDEFNVSIPGYSHKFFFNQNNQPKFVPYSNLKMSYQLDESIVNPDWMPYNHETKGITSFEVYDEDGNKYIFGEPVLAYQYTGSDRWDIMYPGIEATVPSNSNANHIQYICNVEWKLSKIVTKSGDEINFKYALQEVTYGAVSYKSKIERSYVCQYFNKVVKEEKRLISIETKNELVKFIANENRLDLINSRGLNTIEIYNKVNGATALKRRFELELGYFQSNTSESTAYNSIMLQDDFYKRLKLLSISEIGLDAFEKKHVFEYNETYQLPNRLSAKKDFWGYFNNSANEGKDALFPTILVYPTLRAPDKISVFDYDNDGSGTPHMYAKGYRFPSSNGDIAGAFGLKKISYPTGGIHDFTFEPNTYFYKNKNFTGGGLRLKEENIYEPVTKKSITKKYDYSDITDPNKSSGKIINFPVFAYPENTAGYIVRINNANYQVDPFQLTNNINYDYYRYFLSCNSEPEWALGTCEPNNVEYGFIKETVEVDGKTNGYNRYAFKAFDFKEMLSNNYVFFPRAVPWLTGFTYWDNGNYENNCSSTPTHFAGKAFDQEFDSYADTRGLEFDQCAIPICPYSSYEWNRGQLLSKLVFDATNKIVRSETYQYEDFKSFDIDDLVQGLQIRTFENYHIGKAQNIHPQAYGNDHNFFNSFMVYTPYKYYTSNKTILKSRETRAYSSPTTYLTSTTTYKYNSLGQLQAETLINSKNICKKIVYTHPSDLTIGTTSDPLALTILDMQEKNQINEVLEKVTYDNCAGQLSALSSELTFFKTHTPGSNKVIVPFEIHRLENTQSVTFSPIQYINGSIKWDNKYKRDKNLSIDAQGNLNQQNKENDVKNSYIWGFNQTYPIASVEGAGYNDIAYTSFEENDYGYGGWAVTNSFLIPGFAVTGKNNYSLGNGDVHTTKTLNPSTVYILSFWFASGGIPDIPGEIKSTTYPSHLIKGWMYVEKEITGVSGITIHGEDGASGQIDELRLYPKGAKMTTFTYDPLIGATSKCDERNLFTYYEYDGFGRLNIIRDQDNNILKKVCYNIGGSESTGCTVVGNEEQSQPFTRNNCSAGYVGTNFTYIVPAGKYFSSDLEKANALALADIDANGQAKANSLGNCIITTVYAKVRMENPAYVGRYTIGDVVVRFYLDPGYTIPVNVTNLTVNFKQVYYDGFRDTNTITYFSQICNGSSTTIRQQMVLLYMDSDLSYDYSFLIEPGAGYNYSTQYTWPN
jgi:hypothetical protein